MIRSRSSFSTTRVAARKFRPCGYCDKPASDHEGLLPWKDQGMACKKCFLQLCIKENELLNSQQNGVALESAPTRPQTAHSEWKNHQNERTADTIANAGNIGSADTNQDVSIRKDSGVTGNYSPLHHPDTYSQDRRSGNAGKVVASFNPSLTCMGPDTICSGRMQ